MFGPAGRVYIYRIDGLHWMLYIVTGTNEAAAVLVRGVEGVNGPCLEAARSEIVSSLIGLEAVPASGLWFEEPQEAKRLCVIRAPRIWIRPRAAKKLRFAKA